MEVTQPGFGTTVQDRGRHGHRHEGVPLAGWLDQPLAEAANALVGNPPGAAVLELRGQGTVLTVRRGPVRVALTGAISANIQRGNDSVQPLLPWQSATLQNADQLHLGLARTGCAYLALAGGCLVEPQLGSRASYWRAGLHGLLGRPLQTGDLLPCGQWSTADMRERRAAPPYSTGSHAIRVVLGPQYDHFSPEVVQRFLTQPWQTSNAQDRMGMRLQGQALTHRDAAAADIVSDGATPGAIQVPANGLPIVLLADSQTVGGYPKIATVIRADLPLLAHAVPGTTLHFEAVTLQQAGAALRQQQTGWASWLATLEPFVPAGYLDDAALYRDNLISGVLRADPLYGDMT